jgi:hypothetical protein
MRPVANRDQKRIRIVREFAPDRKAMLAALEFALNREAGAERCEREPTAARQAEAQEGGEQ